MQFGRKYRKNKTTELFSKLDKVIFFCSSQNFWVDENTIPELVYKAYRTLSKLVNIAVVFFMVSELGSFLTQHALTEKQKSDRVLMSISHFILYSFTLSLSYHRKTITEILFALAVVLKKDFNDENTESQMLKRNRVYACALVFLFYITLVLYGIDGLIQVCFSDKTFVTVVTVWPEVHDRSLLAGAGRFAIYIIWWVWMTRVTAAYLLVLTVNISLSHQYMNLQMYFKSLEGIFEERNSQSDKEVKYERDFKLGIRLHATTIWCTQQIQRTCGNVFSGHIIVNIAVLVMLMSQMQNSDRALSNMLPIVASAACMLFSTGVVMWSAGDITVEASNLPTAIFQSGWHHCTNTSSYRIRRLLLIALAQSQTCLCDGASHENGWDFDVKLYVEEIPSQKPVVIKCCGFIELSYQSYLSIVKASYSLFSVMY